MDTDRKSIGKRIRDARLNKAMSQDDLATSLGISYQSVQAWERGKSSPNNQRLYTLCLALEISIDWLIAGEIQKEGKKMLVETEPDGSTCITLTDKDALEIIESLAEQLRDEQVKNPLLFIFN